MRFEGFKAAARKNKQSYLSFCSCSALPQRLQPRRLRPLTRLEHEQKSGVISVYFILAEALTDGKRVCEKDG